MTQPPPTTPRSAGNMRASRQRPASSHGAQASPVVAARPARKVFNCIADDSALVAGVKRSTRNGIRQWVKNGQIRLFVPLHALDQLSRQRANTHRHGEDVRETLQWLDEATSKYPNIVTLQGADETYEAWADVETFAVPRSLFSETDVVDEFEPEAELEQLPDEDANRPAIDTASPKTPVSSLASNATRSLSPSSLRSLRSSPSVPSPPTSPAKPTCSPAKPDAATRPLSRVTSAGAVVPPKLQPLFNYILWRIHQEVDPVAALESFIFLCNDQSKVNYAKGFEIKTKRLEQLREAIGREERDYKNRQLVVNRENNQNATSRPRSLDSKKADEEQEDEVVFKPPPKAPAAMLSKQQNQPSNVMDPDAFGRSPKAPNASPKSPRQQHSSPMQSGRGAQQTPFANRGNNARGQFRGGARGRGNANAQGRGGHAAKDVSADGILPGGQIDPDSFSRPRGAGGYAGRGGRKLWVPT